MHALCYVGPLSSHFLPHTRTHAHTKNPHTESSHPYDALFQALTALFVPSLPLRALNKTDIESMRIKMLPGYKDPYHSRPLTKGELGCFLSHYNIWKEVRHSGCPQAFGSTCAR